MSNQPGIVYLQTTVTNEAGEVTQQMIPVHTSALQVSVDCVMCSYIFFYDSGLWYKQIGYSAIEDWQQALNAAMFVFNFK